ncbi:MAG: hypothetical protein AAFX08_05605 [Pseudomonadota bacterium]
MGLEAFGIDIGLWAAVGFLFAAYAVVGNDALQTLGTFINSNDRFPWWVLFIFAGVILVAAFFYGWAQGDPAYGRLDRYPEIQIEWYHALPPFVLLLLTRTGIPVSTTFMVLTIFAVQSANLTSMLEKSLVGYGVAFLVGAGVYMLVSPTLERFFIATRSSQHHPVWVGLQWSATGFLWWQWLSQDFANIYIFLPRQLTFVEAAFSISIVLVLLGVTFANAGGPVQRILRTKRGVTDIRSATIIDFIFAWLLLYFKELNNVPMSTTWVFLGLIAGREFVIRHIDLEPGRGLTRILGDLGDAVSGFLITLFRYLFIGVESGRTAKDEKFIPVTGGAKTMRLLGKFLPLLTVLGFIYLFYVIPSGAYASGSGPVGGFLAALSVGNPGAIAMIALVIVAAAAQTLTRSGLWSKFRLEEEDVIQAADGVHADAVKALIGLVISVVLALGLPRFAPWLVQQFG